MDNLCFCVDDAVEYGLEEAIVLHIFYIHFCKMPDNEQFLGSMNMIAYLVPFISKEKGRSIFDKLEKLKKIVRYKNPWDSSDKKDYFRLSPENETNK